MRIAVVALMCFPVLSGAQTAAQSAKLPAHVHLLERPATGGKPVTNLLRNGFHKGSGSVIEEDVKPTPEASCAHMRVVTPKPDIDPKMPLPTKEFASNMPVMKPAPVCEQAPQ